MKHIKTFENFLNEGRKTPLEDNSKIQNGEQVCQDMIGIVKKYAKLDTRHFNKFIKKMVEDDPYIDDVTMADQVTDFYHLLLDYVAIDSPMSISGTDEEKIKNELVQLLMSNGIKFS